VNLEPDRGVPAGRQVADAAGEPRADHERLELVGEHDLPEQAQNDAFGSLT
jgi:hypothetical protein